MLKDEFNLDVGDRVFLTDIYEYGHITRTKDCYVNNRSYTAYQVVCEDGSEAVYFGDSNLIPETFDPVQTALDYELSDI